MLTNEMEKSTKFQNKWPMSWFIILWMVACNISLTCRAPQVWDLPHVGEMLHAIFTQNTTSYFPLPSHPIPSANYFSLKKSKWTQLPFFFREWWALGLLLERSALKANVIYWHCQLDLQLTRSVLIFNGSHRFLFVALSLSLCFLWFLFYRYGRIHVFLCWIQNFWILTWGRWYFLFVTYYR